jgi:hypothetical protein
LSFLPCGATVRGVIDLLCEMRHTTRQSSAGRESRLSQRRLIAISGALASYEVWLARQPLSPRTRQEYRRWVRLFCAWLGDGADERALGADPLVDQAARDYAARDFKRFLKSERALGAASVNLGLAAVDHFYRHLGVGRANVRREACRSRRRGRSQVMSSDCCCGRRSAPARATGRWSC